MCWGGGALNADPSLTRSGAAGPEDASYAILDLSTAATT
jgi:hypothetical protein